MAEYIEREKLYKRISDIRIYASVARQSGKDLAGELLKFYREGVLKAIADAPAADVVEVKHGTNDTNMNPSDEFICSECGLIMRNCCRYEIDEKHHDAI